MKELPDECVDLFATDPPYGYSFMGKDWDRAVPKVEVWKECLRVMKPGAFGFILCAPRQDCLSRMIVNLEDAGFWVNFSSLYWAYGSGFPKAQNIGKAVDKRGGISVSWFGKWLKEWRTKESISQKEIAKLFPSKTGGLTGCVANWELGLNIPTPRQFTRICRHFDLPFESIEETEREITGQDKNWGKKGSTPLTGYKEFERKDNPKSPQAKALDGSYAGFQPKPAVEVVLVVMKPLSEATYVDQALKNGKGVTWLDEGRIPYESDGDEYHRENTSGGNQFNGTKREYAFRHSNNSGRFPANLLVQDDVLNDGRVIKATNRPNSDGKIYRTNTYGNGRCNMGNAPIDSGSFSRYFDLDRWFAERIKRLPKSVQKTFPFLIVPKASKAEKNRGCEGLPLKVRSNLNKIMGESGPMKTGTGKDRTTKFRNNHPCVKPFKLMCYLITLGSREGNVVLDPYMGSWTTAVACKMLKRDFLGYDDNAEYCEIGKKRIEVIEDKLCLS